MYTALLAQKINKGGSGGEAELSGVPPLTFTADGTPLIDYLISGNTTQNGTPSPDNPVMPQGTGERTENLCDESDIIYDGTRDVVYMKIKPYRLEANETVTVSLNYNATAMWLVNAANNVALSLVQNNNTLTYRRTSALNVYVMLRFDNGTPQDLKVMLNLGSTAMPYEPYGYKISISSATTTPVYLGEVQTTRRIKKYVFTGTETFVAVTAGAHYRCRTALPQAGIVQSITSALSTHYTPNADARDGTITLTTDGGTIYFTDDTNAVTSEAFKSYLAQQYAAGTPVTVWYVLAEPETGIVNEPLMKIGDYADTVSKEQAGVQIPTNNGSTTVDVDTELKPSEVYIKYHTK